MSRWWAWLLLLLMAINADAELYLLKHGEDLYCASDDEDTPALAWNHNLDDRNAPLETVYWSKPSPYYAINCKPEFGERKCGDWNVKDWRIVNSYERDLPPIFDFRWNDLRTYVQTRDKITRYNLFQPPAIQLYLPVSLLVRDNAIIVLRNGSWDWRIVVDGWITSEPRMEVELWNYKTKRFRCDTNCSGLILHNGKRWTTFTLKYEARREGDILKVFNHETGVENTWSTNETLTEVKNQLFYTHRDSPGLLGHWRFHSYFFAVVDFENRLCISITYIAPQRYDAGSEAYVEDSIRFDIPRQLKILHATGNQWKTVKLAFNLTTNDFSNILQIFPPKSNIEGFAIGEIRACSEGVHENVFTSKKSKELCGAIIPNVRDCRGVTLCDSSVCTCAPGFQGHDCQEESKPNITMNLNSTASPLDANTNLKVYIVVLACLCIPGIAITVCVIAKKIRRSRSRFTTEDDEVIYDQIDVRFVVPRPPSPPPEVPPRVYDAFGYLLVKEPYQYDQVGDEKPLAPWIKPVPENDTDDKNMEGEQNNLEVEESNVDAETNHANEVKNVVGVEENNVNVENKGDDRSSNIDVENCDLDAEKCNVDAEENGVCSAEYNNDEENGNLSEDGENNYIYTGTNYVDAEENNFEEENIRPQLPLRMPHSLPNEVQINVRNQLYFPKNMHSE